LLCKTVARHSSQPRPHGALSWSPAVKASDNKIKPNKQKGQRWWSSNPGGIFGAGPFSFSLFYVLNHKSPFE